MEEGAQIFRLLLRRLVREPQRHCVQKVPSCSAQLRSELASNILSRRIDHLMRVGSCDFRFFLHRLRGAWRLCRQGSRRWSWHARLMRHVPKIGKALHHVRHEGPVSLLHLGWLDSMFVRVFGEPLTRVRVPNKAVLPLRQIHKRRDHNQKDS